MPERKGAAYRITSRKPAYTGQEHHQRTHASEMYERMAPDDFPVYGGAAMTQSGAWYPTHRSRGDTDGHAGVREPRRPVPSSPGGRMAR